MRRRSVLILGLRHAVRAPMAEAILRDQVGDALDIISAGIAPAPLHPLTTTVLEEADYALHAHAPVSAKSLLGRASYHTVIIISDQREPRSPRMFLGALEQVTWEIADPSHAPEAERLDAFRACRDRIVDLVTEWTSEQMAVHHLVPYLASERPTRPLRIPKPKSALTPRRH